MREGKVRKLAVLVVIGGIVAVLLKKLRGDPAPQFSNHPTVTGGPAVRLDPRPIPTPAPPAAAVEPDPLPDLVPAPDDPTVPDAHAEADLVAAPVDPTVPDAAPVAGEQAWADPVDGGCPDGYPIKAKVKSGIFHQPGGLAYERTNPDRCYPTAAAAEADGLRAAKR